jgi:hypothetical protein
MQGKVFIFVYACWDGNPPSITRHTELSAHEHAGRLRLKTVVRVRRCAGRGDLHCVGGKLQLTFGRQVADALCTVDVAQGRSSPRA